MAECREVTVVAAGRAEAEPGMHAESPTRESYHVAHTWRTLGALTPFFPLTMNHVL